MHFKNGKLHNDNGAAIIYPNGDLLNFKNGSRVDYDILPLTTIFNTVFNPPKG